jgi:hypothetical protein
MARTRFFSNQGGHPAPAKETFLQWNPQSRLGRLSAGRATEHQTEYGAIQPNAAPGVIHSASCTALTCVNADV